MAIHESNIILFNSDANVKSIITPETLDVNKDTVIRFKPTDSYYVSEHRLEVYEQKLKAFMNNPSPEKIVYTPTFDIFIPKQGYLEVQLSPFQSDVLLLHVSTEYQISTQRDFSNIVLRKLTHEEKEKTHFTIPYTNLEYNRTYFIRVRYGGAGYISFWSDVQEFTIDKPTIKQPILDPIEDTDIEYSNTSPYTVSINVRSSPYIGLGTHGKSIWTIYRKNTQGKFERAWDSGESTKLTLNKITGLFPQTLNLHTTYYLTVKYLGNNQEYSLESEPVAFSVEELTLSTIENVRIFPPVVNINQPSISFDGNFKLTIKGQEVLIGRQDVVNIHWVLVRDDTQVVVYKLESLTNVLNLPKNIILPNTSYTLHLYYTHKDLGNSNSTSFKFTTSKRFVNTEDGLDSPIAISNNVGYYGEIESKNLMVENIEYVGPYKENYPYKQHQEVSKEGKLYLCIKDTPNTVYSFHSYFKEVSPDTTKNYYKSGLPTPVWLVKHIGLNPNLTGPRPEDRDFNIINKQSGWLKFQNKKNQMIYVSKLPIYKEVSVNDLIHADLFHPRRRTIRIGNHLYYIRTLISSLERGYDSLNQDSEVRKLYPEYYTEDRVEHYEEEKIIEYILNGDMSFIDPGELDMETNIHNELCYNHDKLEAYKADLGLNRYTFLGKEIPSSDLRTLVFRPVLELIPEEEYPIHHLSSSLPGKNKVRQEYYDPYLDFAYLGMVNPEQFISSELLSIRTGFPIEKSRENIGWFKFYYKGLVYFLSYGYNYREVTYKDLETYNFISNTPLYKDYKKIEDVHLGKIPYNNILYNVGLPSIMNYTDFTDHVMIGMDKVDIIHNTSKDTQLSYLSNFTEMVYPLLKEFPKKLNEPGYKGSYKEIRFEELIESLTGTQDPNLSFFTRNTTKDGRVFYNNQYKLNQFSMIRKDQPGDVILCITVDPKV